MKISRPWVVVLAALLLLAGSGCATRTLAGVKASGAVGQASWMRTELYFSIGEWTETALSTEAEITWAKFLDSDVTPRFPDGLSVVDVYGQWRSAKAGAAIERERSRLLVIVHPDTEDASARIEALRAIWKQQAGQESVLRVSSPAKVGF